MANTHSALSDRSRSLMIDTVLKLEYPDDPGAALGKHTMVRSTGPDWGRVAAFDQRREELSDRGRCSDDRLIEILCEARAAGQPARAATQKAPATKPGAPDKARRSRRFRFER